MKGYGVSALAFVRKPYRVLWYSNAMEKQDIQRHILAALRHSPYRGNVRRISLFGSQLHGDAKEGSDVDLLIELRQPMSMFKLVALERDLSQELGVTVDLLTPMSLSRYFRADVLKEAEPLFDIAA